MEQDFEESFEAIKKASKRLIRTIELILNISQLQSGTYTYIAKEIDIYENVLQKIFLTYQPEAKEKNLAFILEKETDNTIIRAEEYSINHIFDNLIDNAIKFTNKGEVRVTVFRDEKNRLGVAIKDTGIGIEKSFLTNIFKPFSQEDYGYSRRYEGTGLGLALVKGYCELNNAEINVESEKGKGSTFTVIFNES
jgi:signal transduction histidine kinase